MSGRRRSFGSVRQMGSGRRHARYCMGDGITRTSPHTFARRSEAERFLGQVDLELHRGGWVDPQAGAVPLTEYAERWLAERPQPLRPRTVELYRGVLRRHIVPTFGPVALDAELTARLRRLVDERSRIHHEIDAEVDRLALCGSGWPTIAKVLGVTRQAARQRSIRRHHVG